MPAYTVHNVIVASLQGNDVGRHLVKASTGRLWCVFADRPVGYTNYQLFCAYSDDGGETWIEEQITTVDIYNYICTVAIDSSDNLHLVYQGKGRSPYPTRDGIFYRKRTASGWGAEETVALKDVAPGQESPSIAIDSQDDVHVVWQGKGWGSYPTYRQIIYRKRTAIGWGASEEVTATDVSTAYGEQYPAIAIDTSDDIHLVWGGTVAVGNYSGIRYRKRTTFSWQAQEDVTTELDCYHRQPRLALDSNDHVHVVWFGMLASEGYDAYKPRYRKRGAAGWETRENLCTTTSSQSDFLTISTDKADDIHVIWGGYGWGVNIGITNLQYRKRTATGWEAQVALTDDAIDHWGGSAMWADFPVISSIRTNIPDTGFRFVNEKTGDSVIFYTSEVTITLPTVTTDEATLVEATTATLNGTLVSGGGEACICGFEWGEAAPYGNTTPTESKTTGQSFLQPITGLKSKTTYRFRAYATNSEGKSYGAIRTFTTKAALPTVVTNPAVDITNNQAALTGELTGDGGEACNCGFEWGETVAYGNTTPTQSKKTGQGFNWIITGLLAGTAYHFRAFATNSAGTSYGADQVFNTLAAAPAVTTDPATEIGAESVILNGTLDNDIGEACECGFQWGLDIGYGTITPTVSKTTGQSFSQLITGLLPNTIYHYRAFAANSMGTGYGADMTFATTQVVNKSYALAREEL